MKNPQVIKWEFLEHILLTEYRELQAHNRMRIELQQRNSYVFIVLVTAITGYLVTYASNKGLQALYTNEVVILVTFIPILANVFIWRHFDHDLNIIDKANYIHGEIRPALQRLVGGSHSALAWENFLHRARRSRLRFFTPLISLSQESLPLYILMGTFLAGGWYIQISVPNSAGHGDVTFLVLLILGTILAPFSLAMAWMVSNAYRAIGK